jgi:hypothetical protein
LEPVLISPFSLSKLPEESIVQCALHSDWQMTDHLKVLAAEIGDMLDRVKYPVYLILDLSAAHIDGQDIVVLANEAARGNTVFAHHMNLRGLLLVSDHPMIGLAAEGMRIQTYGFAPVSAHGTMMRRLMPRVRF